MNDPTSILTGEGLSLDAAVLLAECAELAYELDAAVLPKWARHRGFEPSEPFNLGNIQGYGLTAGAVAVLVFRGTSNLGQWIRDARIVPAGDPWGLVHAGFHGGIHAVERPLEEFAKAAAKAERVWVTGHSLGGALAVLAGAWLEQRGISPQVYTYGQPRVGLGKFADSIDREMSGRLWRFVNQNDIVPRLPPGLFYRHCGTLKRIVRPGVLEARSGKEGTPMELVDYEPAPLTDAEYDAVIRELDANPRAGEIESIGQEGRISLFADHAISEYIRLLKDIRKQ